MTAAVFLLAVQQRQAWKAGILRQPETTRKLWRQPTVGLS